MSKNNKRIFILLPLILSSLMHTHTVKTDVSDFAKVVVGSALIIGGVAYCSSHFKVLHHQVYNPLLRKIDRIAKKNPQVAQAAQFVLPLVAIYVGYKLIAQKK